MFVAILYRISGSAEKYTNSFTDVPTTAYYYDAVGWAVHYGIVAGITETQFGPNNSLTREQIFAFLFRYTTDYLQQSYSITQSIGNQADYSNISSYARTSVAWAKTYHILQISNTDYVYPKSTVTRADAALFLTRFSREVIGFPTNDRFGFTNTNVYFPTTHEMDEISFDRMIACINNYYGVSSAAKNKETILAKLNSEWQGSCQGIAFCMYFDKIGKLDFNKNFGNANKMSVVPYPKYSDEVMGAITFYHLAQYLTNFEYTEYYAANGNLESGIAALHAYINNNGATICAHGTANGGHAYIVTKSSYNAANSSYTLYINDPNPRTFVITLTEEYPTITIPESKAEQLTRVGYFRPSDYNFLDNFDLDGAYNDMGYAMDSFATSSYNAEADLFCAEENAFLTVPCVPFELTNAEGEVLTYDGVEYGGDMQVLDSKYIPNGEGCVAEMQLAVKKSDAFAFANLSAYNITFTAIADDYFGSVTGRNLRCVTIDMKEKLISVEGEAMDYTVTAETGVDGYDYMKISGQNALPFSVHTSDDGLITTDGITGENTVCFYEDNLTTVQTATLEFTSQNILDFSDIEVMGTFDFINAGNSGMTDDSADKSAGNR